MKRAKDGYTTNRERIEAESKPTLAQDIAATEEMPQTLLDAFESETARLWFRRIAELTAIAQEAMPDASPETIQKHVSTYQIETARRPVHAPARQLGAEAPPTPSKAAEAPKPTTNGTINAQDARREIFGALKAKSLGKWFYRLLELEKTQGKLPAWTDEQVLDYYRAWKGGA